MKRWGFSDDLALEVVPSCRVRCRNFAPCRREGEVKHAAILRGYNDIPNLLSTNSIYGIYISLIVLVIVIIIRGRMGFKLTNHHGIDLVLI